MEAELVLEILKIAGGTAVIISGLGGFLGKLWVQRILATESTINAGKLQKLQSELDETKLKLQAELDRGLFVHKVQFEKEFKIYEELWSSLIKLRSATLGLRPMMDYIDPNEPEKERKQNRLNRFSEAAISFADIAEKKSPFLC